MWVYRIGITQFYRIIFCNFNIIHNMIILYLMEIRNHDSQNYILFSSTAKVINFILLVLIIKIIIILYIQYNLIFNVNECEMVQSGS